MILNEKSQFHRLTEMTRIGEFVCGDLFLINVYSGEENVLHFHIINNQTREEGCIKIESAEYFSHGSKIMELNSKEKKELQNFLETISPYEEDDGKTYYMLIWEEWNRNNRENRIPRPISIPNYRNL